MQVETHESRLIHMAGWLVDHPKIQRRLCDSEYEVAPEEFVEIMELLENNGFYELILVLAIKNRCNAVLDQAICGLLIEKAGKEWARIGTKQLCQELKDKIREEMRKQRNRTSCS